MNQPLWQGYWEIYHSAILAMTIRPDRFEEILKGLPVGHQIPVAEHFRELGQKANEWIGDKQIPC